MSKKWIKPRIVADSPLGEYKAFIEDTEGRENTGGDPRTRKFTRGTMTDKEYRKQQNDTRQFKHNQGWRADDDD